MRIRVLASAIVVCLAAQLCQAEQFWDKKDYRQWSKDEAARLLRESPWSKSVTFSDVTMNVLGSPSRRSSGAVPAGLTDEHEGTPQVTYQVQLRSAEVLRQAVIRSQQFQIQYDRLAAEQRAKFDEMAKGFIGADFGDDVVVYVVYSSNVQSAANFLATHWRGQNTATMQTSTWLNAGGEKLGLRDFSVAQGTAFQLVFPRPKALAPDASFTVEFEGPGVDSNKTVRVFAEFKLKQMTVKGTTQY